MAILSWQFAVLPVTVESCFADKLQGSSRRPQTGRDNGNERKGQSTGKMMIPMEKMGSPATGAWNLGLA